MTKKKTKNPTLAERAREIGLDITDIAKVADLSRVTVWKALKSNTLPPRNSTAFKLRKALRLDEVAHA